MNSNRFYRNGEPVNLMCKDGQVIYQNVSHYIEPVPDWDFTFRFNFNAKRFNVATNKIPNTTGGTETKEFYLSDAAMAKIVVYDDYLDLTAVTSDVSVYWDFGSTGANPYNFTSTSKTGTLVAKTVSRGTSYTDGTFCQSRVNGTQPLNWGYLKRDNRLWSVIGSGATSANLYFTGGTIDGLYSAMVVPSGSNFTLYASASGSQVLTSDNSVEGTKGSFPSSNNTQYFKIFHNKYDGGFNGKFYWVFYSDEALTLEQINKIIAYNESL